MTTLNINSLTINQKRDLVKALREAIKKDTVAIKAFKINQKVAKENAKKEKIANQIKAAQEKLAKLQARLTA
jgi:ribosome recycling factor